MIRSRVYRNGNLEAQDVDVDRISDYLGDEDYVVWMDLCDPPAAEVAKLAEEVGLAPLAVEDALSGGQRPKVDHYSDHVFITAYAVRLDVASGVIAQHELAVFGSHRYLVTMRHGDGFDIDSVLAAWDDSPDLAKYGVGFLLYGLLDVVVDGHLEAIGALDEAIDDLEDLVFDERPHNREVQLRSYRVRKSLVQLRRVLLPMRELLTTLVRREADVVGTELAPYYQDVYDHVVRAAEQSDSLRDLVATIFETSLTIRSNRLNEIMKKVTSYAALFAVPTAITGYYGMNVETWPQAGTTVGGVFALALTVLVTGALFLAFRRREWL